MKLLAQTIRLSCTPAGPQRRRRLTWPSTLPLTGELWRARDRLSELIGAEKETELVQLDTERQETKTVKESIAQNSVNLEDLKPDLVATEGELQTKVQRREADIQAALKSLGVEEPASLSKPAEPSPQRKTDSRERKPDR
jgi:hypothetical protein